MPISHDPLDSIPSTAVRRGIVDFRQDLLLFDEIIVMGLETHNAVLVETHPALVADTNYLADMGVISSGPYTASDVMNELYLPWDNVDWDAEHLPTSVHDVLRVCSAVRHPSADLRGTPDGIIPHGGELLISWMYSSLGHSSLPLLPRGISSEDWMQLGFWGAWSEDLLHPTSGPPLLNVVLRALPIPGNDVPIEDVLDFVADTETRRKRQRLLMALQRAEIGHLSALEFQQEIAESLHAYSEHIQLANMRTTNAKVDVLVNMTLGPLEELLHLRPAAAIQKLLGFRDIKPNRIEAELSSPGAAFAFIYDANKRFSSQR